LVGSKLEPAAGERSIGWNPLSKEKHQAESSLSAFVSLIGGEREPVPRCDEVLSHLMAKKVNPTQS